MIRSTSASLKFINTSKQKTIDLFIEEYRRVVEQFIDIIWEISDIKNLLEKEITDKITDSWLSARAIQCAGKQASGIVRGTKKKQKQRLWKIEDFKKKGMFKKARKLQRFYDKVNMSKPSLENVNPELDSRFIKIDLENETSFDGWITLSSIGNKLKVQMPFKKTKHFNKMLNNGDLKKGIRLSKDSITFMFDLPDLDKKANGNIVGIDIGQSTVISCSNGISSTKDIHGHDLSTITTKLCRKKKESKAFLKTQRHRKNYINWTINQLNFNEVKEIKLENIKNIRKGKRTSKRLNHWTYTEIFDKIESKCEQEGVLVTRVNPTYTSQRCSACGWTRRGNRKGKLFKCDHCDFIYDADLNASNNIVSNLKPIWYKKRHLYDIKTGFYWNEEGQDSIVPAVAN